jgi:transposase
LNNPKITPILHELIAITASPLKEVETGFAVDSTGFRTTCFGAYCEGKYPTGRQHKWLKLHASCGVKTNIITAVRITEGEGADSPQLIPLTEETAQNGFDMQKVYADKGYIGKDNLERITELGATPYIPFKSNTSGKSGGSTIWRKAYFYFKMNQDEFMQNYHQRSNIESTFAAMKKKLGEVLKSRLPVAQENELLCKVIAYNIMVLIQEMHELGIAVDFAPQ